MVGAFFVVPHLWASPCKVNLLLNILGRREDGFHELETVMVPVPITDTLVFERARSDIHLECSHPELPVDRGNLVYRAAALFRQETGIREGVWIRLEKHLPLAAGLGGGSANAAVTLRAMNELFGRPHALSSLEAMAARLGSDVPFFLEDGPALATGRGERVERLPGFPLLRGRGLVLVHPGFGVSTAWAYRALGEYPEALRGRPGRGRELVAALGGEDPAVLGRLLYNSLEAPVLAKHPLLRLIQDHLRSEGAWGALMSGSGSTTFALTEDRAAADRLAGSVRARFGGTFWVATAAL